MVTIGVLGQGVAGKSYLTQVEVTVVGFDLFAAAPPHGARRTTFLREAERT